ncbi:MAG: TonB-dependent receptor [Bacteroidia bacterium]
MHFLKYVYFLPLLLSNTVFSSTFAYPENNNGIKPTTDTLKKQQLEEVPVHAVRAEREQPVTTGTLDKEAIKYNYTGQEMPVILSRTPSVTWYSDGGHYTGYSYMRLRGIDQTRINFTLNGVPLNEPEDQGAYFSNYPDFLNSIRSIQIQRGVGLSTNGTASFAGSVNMESPLLNDTSYTELGASFGSYSTYRISPEFSTGILKNNWSFYGRYSNAGTDGFREHSGNKGQSFFYSGGYIGKKGILKFTGFTGVSKNEMSYLAVADSALKHNYRSNPLSSDENDEFTQSLLMLSYIVPLSKNSILTTTVYYNYLQGGYSILFAPDLYKFSVQSNFYGGILNYQFQKNKLKLNTGLHCNDYTRYHYASVLPLESKWLYKNHGNKKEVAAYLKLSYTYKQWILFGDVQARHVQFNYSADNNTPLSIPPVQWQFLNPKAGASYSLNNKHVLYISTGRTSREPTRNDMFAGYDNIDSLNYMEVGALNRVKPETVTDFEAGLKLLYAKLALDANIFYMQFKNEIAAIGQLSYIGLPLRKNVNSSYRRGVELSLTANPFQKLNFISNAAFSTNRIKSYTTDYDSVTYTNVQPLLTPRVIIDQTINYRFSKYLLIGANGRYMSMAFLDNTNNTNFMVPASLIFNASIELRFLKHYSINFMVNNITNTRYYTSGYVQNGQPYYFAMATRNYFMTLRARF